ncbi:MAG: penicillin-binding protein 2 [Gammaproteobacteria bacterium]|nr:penicillin-binding protein 2 [Gammaproteobacteria bacterium]
MLNIPLKDYLRETRIFNARLGVAAVLVIILTVLLLIRLTYLQVINYRHYATLSQANRIRPLPIPPARGVILDRNGVVLAQNFPVYTLEVVPEQVDDMNELVAQLMQLVRVTDGDLKAFYKQMHERPRFENITLRSHLNEEEAARVAVRLPFLNGAELRARLQRHYPLGGLAVHALGYVSRISELDLARIDKSAYRGMQQIGKTGLEATYEDLLVGKVGFEQVETNAHGRALRTLDRIAPTAGKNLYLSLDAQVQAVAEQALGKYRGAVVAMDPSTGAVLAYASTPTYDPNEFVNGIDSASYQALLTDPDKPLVNRAINGQYSPGSTIKVFLGMAALEAGPLWDANRPVLCDGSYNLPGSIHQFRDWKHGGHGMVTLHDAIVQSCDVYFYRLAVTLGPERMKDFLIPFGFGHSTGIDLPGESQGLLPSPAWRKAHGQPWYPGETVVAGIGQGAVLVTPVQLATAMSVVANRGFRFKPTLLRALEDPRTKERQDWTLAPGVALSINDKSHWDQLYEHLMGVVHSPHGTAQGIGRNAPYHIGGKTGTAQVKSIAQGARYDEHGTPERFRDHALFVGFAPVEDPKVAVAVVVENGGHGSSVAAPIARKVMDQVILGKQADGKPVVVPPAPPPTAKPAAVDDEE